MAAGSESRRNAVNGFAQVDSLSQNARSFCWPARSGSSESGFIGRRNDAALRGKRQEMTITLKVIGQFLGRPAIVHSVGKVQAQLATA